MRCDKLLRCLDVLQGKFTLTQMCHCYGLVQPAMNFIFSGEITSQQLCPSFSSCFVVLCTHSSVGQLHPHISQCLVIFSKAERNLLDKLLEIRQSALVCIHLYQCISRFFQGCCILRR